MTVVAGKGTLLKLNDTTIAYRATISGPNRSVGTDDITNLDSSRVEMRPTLPDNGDMTLEIQYDPKEATHQSLEALVATPSVEEWTLVFSNGANYTITGFLTAFGVSGMEPTGHVRASITIRCEAVTIDDDASGAGFMAMNVEAYEPYEAYEAVDYSQFTTDYRSEKEAAVKPKRSRTKKVTKPVEDNA